MAKLKYLKFLNPVFVFFIFLIPFVSGSYFHWSLLALSILMAVINGYMMNHLAADYENLYQYSYFDSLSGIPNRLSADLYCERLESLDNLSVAVTDLDNLKNTNDIHGHHTGDILIKNFASIFSECASAQDFTARIGGDEFIIFMNSDSSEQDMQTFLLNLQAAVSKYNASSSVPVSYSIGCVLRTETACRHNIHELISAADARMYEEKRKKKAEMKTLQKGGQPNEKEI